MKVIDIINQVKESGKKSFSFELLPPLKGDGLDKIFGAIESLLPYGPSFINVTSHREEMKYVERPDGLIEKHVVRRRPGTTGVCTAIRQKYGIEVVPHVICGGMSKYDIEDLLIDLDFLGIQNVLALRGDAMPGAKRFTPNPNGYAHSDALVSQIVAMNKGNYIDGEPNTSHSTDFCIGVAGYPEKHAESPNFLTELGYLKQKIDLGAEYIATQISYSTEQILRFRDRCSENGINVPILPGLKPFATKSQLTVLPQTFGVVLPQMLVDKVAACKDNDDVKKVGIEWGIKQGETLLREGFPVLHFYTMTRTQQVQEIVKALM
ncbi:MAG: methylenetetrahydrofolate reductase [Prevotella sp.]|nr:methylenetetrahydrofolate reductase [Prevotella sp.]MBQ9561546.1 methylenetetrahydrofolate reductase [Prevotella sp.]